MAADPTESDETLANLLHEQRRFPPEAGFSAQANATSSDYDEADGDRLAFWARQAERLDWSQKWREVLDWSNPPFAKWFVGGWLNAAYNCLDRHVAAGRGDKVTYYLKAKPGTPARSLMPSSPTSSARQRTR